MEPNQNSTQPSPTPQTTPIKTNGLAIAGLILAFFIPLLGLILSIIGLVKAKDYNGNGRGLSIAGIVISIIMMLISIAFFIGVIASVNEAAKKSSDSQPNNTSKESVESLELETYNEKSGAYSLKLPKGWKIDQTEGSRNITALPSSKTRDYVSNASTRVDKVYLDQTLADYVASEVESLTKYNGGTIKSEADVTINGINGHEIVAHKDTGGNVSENYIVILVKGDSVYNLSYKTSPERADKYLPVFKASAQSFVAK